MDNLLERILIDTSDGKIDKSSAINLIEMIKENKVNNNEDIAIIGVGLRFPFSNNMKEFWKVVYGKFDCIRRLPENRKKDVDEYLDFTGEYDHRNYLDGAYLDRIDCFDSSFFNITPYEAKLMDPYQRLFLQVAWETIEDSGLRMDEIKSSRTGVYIGCAPNIKDSYQNFILNYDKEAFPFSIAANIPAMIPARISYLLDLKGPAITIDTACSSSLVAIHQACEGIKNGDCDLAIAGAMKLHVVPIEEDIFKIGIEASDGRTRAFDEKSDGAGFGEGVASVLLKPLSKAVRDNDNIYAVIKGGAVNQDGKSMGITAPNPMAQKDVLLKAWKNSGVDPCQLDFIETHGTGTSLGDPIEVQGITQAFGEFTDKKQFCAISSVKSNIGHLYECAGMASLIKSILGLKNRTLLSSLHFNTPNMKINFEDSPVYVNTRNRKVEESKYPMRCGVSSFGFSGTNCHLVLEEAPQIENNDSLITGERILPLSADNLGGLITLINRYKEFFKNVKDISIDQICSIAAFGRNHYRHRVAILAQDFNELKEKLDNINFENIEKLNEYNIFYGEHKLINRDSKVNECELTIQEKRELNILAEDITNKDMKQVCKYYVKGADIVWEKVFGMYDVKKISIPTYPFNIDRYWVENKNENIIGNDKYFYGSEWVISNERLNYACPENEKILVFTDGSELGNRLIDILEISNEVYEFHFKDSIDYKNIFLEGDLKNISVVINLCDGNDENFEKMISIFNGIEKITKEKKVKFFGIAKNANKVLDEDMVNPKNRSLLALISSFEKENENIITRVIDIDSYIDERLIIGTLFNDDKFKVMALRKDKLYVQELVEKKLDMNNDRKKIKEHGVYVITGGTGGLGLEVAKYISETENVKIALINRNDIYIKPEQNKEKINIIENINQRGRSVKVYSCNISDEIDLSSTLGNIRNELGSIDGIFHCAGVVGTELLMEKSMEKIREVLDPKIKGTLLLDKFTEKDDLDFMVLFSSISVVFGGPYQLDYIAANSFLDSFAYCREQRGKRTISINWSTWKEAGVSYKSGFNMDTIFKAIETSEAIRCLNLVLNSDEVNLIIGQINKEAHYLKLLQKSNIGLSSEITKFVQANISKNIKDNRINRTQGDLNIIGKADNQYSDIEMSLANIIHKILGVREIDINDNFFELGADSILIKKIHQEIKECCNDKISITEIFQYPTISQLNECIIAKESSSESVSNQDECTIEKQEVNEENEYQLSSQQKRQYVLNCLNPNETNYNISKALIFEGKLDIDKLNRAVQEVVNKHESLRASFYMKDGLPIQKIHEHVNFEIEREVIKKDISIERKILESIKPFDLKKETLLRIKILSVSEIKNILIFDMHHIIGDGESINIFIRDICKFYLGKELTINEFHYKDYVKFQNDFVKSNLYKKQEEFWSNMHKDRCHRSDLLIDYKRGNGSDFSGRKLYKTIDIETTRKIKSMALKNNSTLFMVLFAAFSIVTLEYYNEDDLVIGTPIISRPDKKFDDVIGLFVNTLAIRVKPNVKNKFKDYLNEVRKTCIEAFENQEYQFDDLIKKLNITRKNNRNPLFDVFFALQNVGSNSLKLDDVKVRPYNYNSNSARFDIAIDILEENNELNCILEYKTGIFNEETIESLFYKFEELLREIVDSDDLEIGDLISLKKEKEENKYDFSFDF